MSHARTADHPEAVLKIFWLLSEKTSNGGAVMDEMIEAYAEIKGKVPDERTIRRIITRINLLFDPLAESLPRDKRLITRTVENGIHHYRLTQNTFRQEKANPSLAMRLLLSLYPHKPHMDAAHFKQLTHAIFNDALRQENERRALQHDMDKHVYVCGTKPASPEIISRQLSTIFDAIRREKGVIFDYFRSSDGSVQKSRRLNPYGILCRQDIWYLVGRPSNTKDIRIFRCDHIERLRIEENSVNRIPDDFSLEAKYGASWGTWTESQQKTPQTVRIRVSKRLANKFQTTTYHSSQVVNALPSGDIEVSFRISEPSEMLPWLIGWGNTIEVIEPDELRKELKAMALEIAAIY